MPHTDEPHNLPPTTHTLPTTQPRKRCWKTDRSEHNGERITALYYRQGYESLFGGDGHGGWLVSGSDRMLNLWECSRSAGRGEPALQIMHQQVGAG